MLLKTNLKEERTMMKMKEKLIKIYLHSRSNNCFVKEGDVHSKDIGAECVKGMVKEDR
jgi:hypothetical protein